MRIQLWTCQYDPEPLGIGPLAGAWAREMLARGYRVDVVAAHPHYPEPRWGSRLKPYRENRDGMTVYRLPLKVGRKTRRERLTQELSFLASLSAAAPLLPGADVQVAISPSFPALLPAMLNAEARRTPWVIWLQDILPDGAASTGYVDRSGPIYRASRGLEDAAYRSAAHVVVLSESFRENLISKGVPGEKISLAYNPATFPAESLYRSSVEAEAPPRILCMGNIGKSQNIPAIIAAFEANRRLEELDARLVIAGTGVAEDEARAAIKGDRVEMPGLLLGQDLVDELARADLGLVSQSYDGGEFNVPSKLMNYLAVGLPVVASVDPEGEVAGILERSGAGWMTDRVEPPAFAEAAAEAITDPAARQKRSGLAVEFASRNLMPSSLADTFERVLAAAADGRRRPGED
jgi:colanic acid biosynthesis glycosyl transferase WcaI